MAKQLLVKFGLTLPCTAAPDNAFEIIGTVHQGPGFGYLAISPAGDYLQLNGSVTRTLNAAKVRAAIAKAEGLQRGHKPVTRPRRTQPQSPVVIVRKKRRVPLESGTPE
jgi:hypothetical protein